MAAARVAQSGMDPLTFLNNTDPFEVAVMQAVAQAREKMSDRDDHNRAVLIANAVVKSFGGG